MINETLNKFLLERNEVSDLNFTKLVEMLEDSEYEFIGGRLRGIMGLATHKKAYFDMIRMNEEDNQLIFFVILHEYCHVLRIDRIGKGGMIKKLSTDNFDEYFEHIIEEEILADRFGSYFYHHHNKRNYPKYRTQQLNKKQFSEAYKINIGGMHGKIKDEESYDKLMEYLVIEYKID